MNKYVLAYDTHQLDEENFTHDDVRKVIIEFLLNNGVLAADIKEPVQTTFTFKSEVNTEPWKRLINRELLPALTEMMEDVFYYFGSIKQDNNGVFYEQIKPNPVLQRNLNVLIQEVERARRNR